MDNYKKLKLLAQFFPALLAVIFLCVSFYYGKENNNSLRDVFIGAFIGTIGIVIINLFSILVTHKAEIDVQNEFKDEIAERARVSILNRFLFINARTKLIN